MGEKLDVLIENKEAALLPLCSRMEELKPEFTKATVDFAFNWYRKTAKEYITKYPEITLKLSDEKIAQTKTSVNELVKNTEKTVHAEFDNPSLWWHQKTSLHNPINKYKQISDKYQKSLTEQ